MNRRQLIRTLAGASAAHITSGAKPSTPQLKNQFNVLFLMSDEHSPHAVGCLGNRIVKTPAIDSLANRGTAFTAAYTQNPICVPSRASFVTGRMPSNVGVFGNDGGLDESVTTMADVFKRAGYVAGWMGKTHWGGDPRFDTPKRSEAAREATTRRSEHSRLPETAEVVDWPVEEEFDTITRHQALRFLEENRAKRFFAGVSFKKPHFPFLVQEPYYRMYKDSVDAPRVTQKLIDELPLVSQGERKTYGFAKLTEAQIKKARAVYYGMVTYIDDQIKDILKKVEKTIILYIADHGEMGGEHGLWYKNSFYEASARIPFVWSFPKAIPQGVKIDTPVMNMDVFPTLCDLCGLEKPAGLEGRSLIPLIKGSEDGKNRYALSENFRASWAGRMIRVDRWKYCYFHEDREQLFDLGNDPGEIVNLVGKPEHKDLVASLKSRALRGWHLERFFEKKKNKARKAAPET
jgi:choline-sulfatase